jgi:hypothetical protein
MEYDREWTTRRGLPANSRLRFGLTKRAGVPVRFLVQLEYRHRGRWHPVARFDHDAFGPAYRNVELVGLHLDVYDPEGMQVEKRRSWSPQPARAAMGAAEEYLRRGAERLVRRFEAWL